MIKEYTSKIFGQMLVEVTAMHYLDLDTPFTHFDGILLYVSKGNTRDVYVGQLLVDLSTNHWKDYTIIQMTIPFIL